MAQEGEQPELLATTHVKRRTAKLQERREELDEEKKSVTVRVLEFARLIALCEWLPEGTRDIEISAGALEGARESERITDGVRVGLAELRAAMPGLDEAASRPRRLSR